MSLVALGSLGGVVLFVAMLLAMEAGRRLGLRSYEADREGFGTGLGAAEGAVFGLLGLLIAFTFSGAWSRFEARRHLVTEEANAIGTSWLRIDLLPTEAQPEVRALYRRYADVRIATYEHGDGRKSTQRWLVEAAELHSSIWKKTAAALHRPETLAGASQSVVPALNAMIDITTTRVTATENHPPIEIYVLLVAHCLVASLLFGYGAAPNRERMWVHKLVFSGTMALSLYVVADLEFPRNGVIRIHEADHVLVEVRDNMR